MEFKFGVYGFKQSELENTCGPFLNGFNTFRAMKFRDNFIEFSTSNFWQGLEVVNGIVGSLALTYPEKLDPNRTKIWVNGDTLEIFLLDKIRTTTNAMREAILILRKGRAKNKIQVDGSAKQARLTLERTLKMLKM